MKLNLLINMNNGSRRDLALAAKAEARRQRLRTGEADPTWAAVIIEWAIIGRRESHDNHDVDEPLIDDDDEPDEPMAM